MRPDRDQPVLCIYLPNEESDDVEAEIGVRVCRPSTAAAAAVAGHDLRVSRLPPVASTADGLRRRAFHVYGLASGLETPLPSGESGWRGGVGEGGVPRHIVRHLAFIRT